MRNGRQILLALIAVNSLSAIQLFGGGLPGTLIGSPGSWANSGNTIAKAFDSNLSTFYDAANGSGDWAGLDFGSGTNKVIKGVRYCPRTGFANRMVGGQFQGANVPDFSAGVVTLLAITSAPPDGELTTQAINNSTAFRYVRYIGPASANCNVAEVEFYDAGTWPVVLFSDLPEPWAYTIWADANSTDVNASYNNTLRWAWPGGFIMSQRQSGVFRQTRFTESGDTAAGGAYDYLTQVNNTNQPHSLMLASDPASGHVQTWVSPQQDFAAFIAQGVSVTDVKVSINPLGPGSTAPSSDGWAGIGFGSPSGSVITNGGTGVLVYDSGTCEVWDSGVKVATKSLGRTDSNQFYNVDFQINSTNGAYTLLINGAQVAKGTHSGGYQTNNYITLQDYTSPDTSGTRRDYFKKLLVSGTQPVAKANTSYYLSPTGNDTNSGTSSSAPWRTLARASVEQFQPGDTLLLQGGETFNGCLNINSSGTPAAPLTISSYGTGNSTINSGAISSISALNAHDLVISNLTLVGNGYASNKGDGITIINDTGATPLAATLVNISINNVDSSNFGGKGMSFLGSINNVTVTQSSLHDNGQGGLWVQGGHGNNQNYGPGNLCTNYVVDHVNASHNPGTPGDGWSGYGIAVANTIGVVINRCVAGNNGWLPGQGGAMSGIQVSFSDHVLIQYNEAYKTFKGSNDGQGICFEQCRNSIAQYNYTHDNDGSGTMILGDEVPLSCTNVVIRYTISLNDAQNGGETYGGIFAGVGRMTGIDIYNNTIFFSPSTRDPNGCIPYGIRLLTATGSGNFIRNNIVVSSAANRAGFDINDSGDVNSFTVQGNDWWCMSGAPTYKYIWTTYSLTNYRKIIPGFEMLSGKNVALQVNPGLNNPGGGGTIGNADQLTNLTAYQLKSTSPLLRAGLDLSQFGVVWDPYHFAADPFLGQYFSTNPLDFYGNTLPAAGSGLLSVGAHQPNAAPALNAISDQTITAGQTMSITNVATDANMPPQTLTYSLSVAPDGASINPTNGILTWRPTMAQSLSNNSFSVVVKDDGIPSLSATQSFAVTVLQPTTPTLGSFVLSHGVLSLSVSGDSGPDYILLETTNLVPPVIWHGLGTNLAATVPFSFSIPTTNPGANFYRLQLGP